MTYKALMIALVLRRSPQFAQAPCSCPAPSPATCPVPRGHLVRDDRGVEWARVAWRCEEGTGAGDSARVGGAEVDDVAPFKILVVYLPWGIIGGLPKDSCFFATPTKGLLDVAGPFAVSGIESTKSSPVWREAYVVLFRPALGISKCCPVSAESAEPPVTLVDQPAD